MSIKAESLVKIEISEGKIYSPVSKFAEQAKNIDKIYSPPSKHAERAK